MQKVARQLIAFGRLKLHRFRAAACETDYVARQLIAFGRLKPRKTTVSELLLACRKTTNRLRAIETSGRPPRVLHTKKSQDN